MGGRQPISGATVTLYRAGKTGNGSAPTVLGTGTTDSTGAFSISHNSTTCSDPDQLYLVAAGGDPGVGSTNTSNVLVEALGSCSSISSSTNVVINELTTVIAAEALAGFSTQDGSSTAIGSVAANTLGLKNAFGTATSLISLTGALQQTTANGGKVPYTLLASLGNSLAACVNSAGLSSAGCTTIVTADFGGVTPANTWQIALQWAKYPMSNAATVFANATSATNFYTPALAAAPHDLSVAIQYAGGTQSNGTTAATGPSDVRVDGSGNIWVAGMASAPLVELSANGALLSPSGGWGSSALQAVTTGKQLAIDAASPLNLWLADSSGYVWKYTPSTATTTQITVPTAIYIAGSTSSTTAVAGNPYGISVDASNNVWFGTYKSSSLGYFGRIPASSITPDTSYAGTPTFPSTSVGSRYVAVSPTTGDILGNGTGSGFYNFLSPYTGAVAQGTTTTNYHSGGSAFTASGAAWTAIIGSTSSSYSAGYGGVCVSTTNTAGCSSKYFFPQPYGSTALAYTTNYFGSTIAIDSNNMIFAPASQLSGGANLFLFNTASGKYLTNGGLIDGYSTSAKTYGDGLEPVDATGASVLASATTTIVTTGTSPLPGVAVDPSGSVWLVNTAAPTYPVLQILGVAAPTGSISAVPLV